MSIPDFDPDFATPAEWAAWYRALGFQVVPCHGKIPALEKWKEFQSALVSDATFASWYGPDGRYAKVASMGAIMGEASSRRFMLDLDTYKSHAPANWYQGVCAVHNNGMELETWEQVTGGGGRQLFLECPAGWMVSNASTALHIDIRGHGGFTVLPPSRHASGRQYEWKEGRAPSQIPLLVAPAWLVDEIEALVGAHGTPDAKGERTASPEMAYDAFGNVQDGREKLMRDHVWRGVLELYRQAPIAPGEEASQVAATAAYEAYERKVKSRLPGDKRAGLEREGRGPTAFASKWSATMRHWGSEKMAREAAKPKPDKPDEDLAAEFAQSEKKAEEKAKAAPGDAFYETLDVPQIKAMADPKWLVDGLIIEEALGFIYGPPGCLKTFIGLDMALSMAMARSQWWGRGIQRTGTVIYVSSEGQGDLKFRVMAWEQHRGVKADTAPFRLIRQSINFMNTDAVTKLLATIQSVVDQTAQPVAAVFVDTVSRVLPGANENLQEDMTKFVFACDQIRQRFKATVIGIHHTARAGNMRGSTVIPGAGDFIIEVRREPGAMGGSIYATKLKAAEDGWEQYFKVTKVQLGDIGGHTSLVTDPSDQPVGQTLDARGWPEKNVLREILATIAEQWFKKQPWGASPNSARPAVRMITSRWRLKRNVVVEILDHWVANNIIVDEVFDAKKHVKGYRKLVDI